MATFTCSACNFSKPVKDEMAGKKARCPKCNEVNDIPPLEEQAGVEAVESVVESGTAPAAAAAAPVETPEAPTSDVQSSVSAGSAVANSASLPKLSKGWVLGFAGAGLLLALAAALLVFQMVDMSLICFAAGTILFFVLAVMFVFADSLGKRK